MQNSRIKVSIYKRPSAFYMMYRDPVSGLKVRKSTETKRKTDANRIARDWEKRINEGQTWKDGDINWHEFRLRFRAEHLESLAVKTQEKADSVLDAFEANIKPRDLSKLNAQTLSKYQQHLRKIGRADATIKGHLAYLRSALSWAKDQGLINSIPAIPKVRRAEKSTADTPMKGRPLTLEEFERMLLMVGKVITKPNRNKKRDAEGNKLAPVADDARIPSWELLLNGLWLSGLRLGEALELRWDDNRHFSIVTNEGRPKFRIPSASQKANKTQMAPMTPDFAEFLPDAVPARRRRGFVFNPLSLLAVHSKDENRQHERMKINAVGKVIGKIGKQAGVVVAHKTVQPETGRIEKPVFASAHDLRRSFGERWSELVMPKVLRELMRHANIDTTMRFYVGQNAERTTDLLWRQFGTAISADGSQPGTQAGNSAGQARRKAVKSK